MRIFLGGISKVLLNWHYVAKDFDIVKNKHNFMIESMVKTIGNPPYRTNNSIIKLEETFITSVEDKKIILEPLECEAIKYFKPSLKIRNNYPEYYYIEKPIVATNCSDELNRDIYRYLREFKKVKSDKVTMDIYKIDIHTFGLRIVIS